MRALLTGSLIVIVIAGFFSLIYAIYNDGYAYGFEAGYSQGYSTSYTQQGETAYNEANIESEFSYNEDTIGNQTIASSSQTIELRNPTFDQVRDFISQELTNKNKWARNNYECRHFATGVCNNARDAGLNCAFVLLCYENEQHAIVAFDTIDKGLIYIEPQTDMVVHPEVGGRYDGKEIKEILIAWWTFSLLLLPVNKVGNQASYSGHTKNNKQN